MDELWAPKSPDELMAQLRDPRTPDDHCAAIVEALTAGQPEISDAQYDADIARLTAGHTPREATCAECERHSGRLERCALAAPRSP